ncbi:hypothetical protein SAMN06297129_1064 [Pseudooceanicola antarcticus]|uniref:Lipoprotein n=1 Tax=Pseudooceanicola antarcticus TaxID=1247613 RepID=A0A285IG18_9RHOB|nr:hypothetical protein [Pseudooceanicola antarcticus]SNY46909.1 hypothetical protein SAMN06297129_1064 [Pseudooceanicola antarcticus]
MRLLLPLALPLLLLLTACGQPDPYFRESAVTRVEVQGDIFDVRLRGRLAEAVRRNPRYAPRLGPVGPRAANAMQAVSGCRVAEIRGDAAMVLGLLDCGAGSSAGDRRKRAPASCEIVERWRLLGGQEEGLLLDCLRI